jgi:fused signal recognition particle receptor
MVNRINTWKESLTRTRKSTFGRIASLLGTNQITANTWDNLEAMLIQADLGVLTTQALLSTLQTRARLEGWTKGTDLHQALEDSLRASLDSPPVINFTSQPAVILLVGVNGSGKTTCAAKLGHRFHLQGHKVLLAAADTFRAAAVDQLQMWGERLGLPVIAGQSGGDPGAVTYDAIKAALSRQVSILLIDTAGRLHTRYNLMEELKKVHRVASKALPGAPHAIWLVMDATTGQNALQQARAFKEAVQVTGIILAKLDTSARGGMAFAIQRELGIPILFAGLGEKPTDLQPFDPDAFVAGILDDINFN